MSHSQATRGRPLSPHLTIYRPPITMTMSIIHRITGGALYFGTLLVAWWLTAAAGPQAYFDFVNGIFGSWIGQLVLFGYTWALLHHLLGGVRHLVWDTGAGLEKHTASRIGWATIIGSVVLTILVWVVGYMIREADHGGYAHTLKKVGGLGSAREGTGHFWHLRLTAIANIPLTLFFVGFLIAMNGASYSELRAALANPLVTLLIVLMLISALYHMRLGMQIIIEDYVHGEGGKLALLILNTFFTIIVGVVSIFALAKLAFGG